MSKNQRKGRKRPASKPIAQLQRQYDQGSHYCKGNPNMVGFRNAETHPEKGQKHVHAPEFDGARS